MALQVVTTPMSSYKEKLLQFYVLGYRGPEYQRPFPPKNPLGDLNKLFTSFAPEQETTQPGNTAPQSEADKKENNEEPKEGDNANGKKKQS